MEPMYIDKLKTLIQNLVPMSYRNTINQTSPNKSNLFTHTCFTTLTSKSSPYGPPKTINQTSPSKLHLSTHMPYNLELKIWSQWCNPITLSVPRGSNSSPYPKFKHTKIFTWHELNLQIHTISTTLMSKCGPNSPPETIKRTSPNKSHPSTHICLTTLNSKSGLNSPSPWPSRFREGPIPTHTQQFRHTKKFTDTSWTYEHTQASQPQLKIWS
jgi:hypothetical protein